MGFKKYEGEFTSFSDKVKLVVDALVHSVTNEVAVVFDKEDSGDDGLVARIRTQAAKLGHSVSVKTEDGLVVIKAVRKNIGEAVEEAEEAVEENEAKAEASKPAPPTRKRTAKS